MKKFKYLLLCSFLFSIAFSLEAQNKKMRKGNEEYEINSYYLAAKYYEKALKKRKIDSTMVADRLAFSYYWIGEVEPATKWFRFIYRNGEASKNQLLRLALLERQMENYERSKELLIQYKKQYGEDGVAPNYFNETTLEELKKNKGNFVIELQEVSSEYSDIAATMFSPNEVILSSSIGSPKNAYRIDSWKGNYLYNIYRAPIDEKGNIGKSWQRLDFSNMTFNGPAIYNEKTKSIYFTRNNIRSNVGIDQDSTFRLKIFRVKTDNKKFKKIEDLGINSGNYSNAHPSVSEDGKRMYFASDRPGGYGGMDIYYVNLNEDGMPIGEPINMGAEVNTPLDEMFPYYNYKEGLLFFSSEGHFGLGGLDIYVTRIDKHGRAKGITNLGAPINSPYDDFTYIGNESQTEGYFSSNRPGGKGSDDIYKFYQKISFQNKILDGIVKNEHTGEAIQNATVYLLKADNKVADSMQTDKEGLFSFSLNDIKENFKLSVSKDGYSDNVLPIKFDKNKQEYNEVVKIAPKMNYFITGLVKDAKTKTPLDNVKVSIVDNKDNSIVYNLTTGTNGKFNTSELPYKFGDEVSYGIRLEKDNFITKSVALAKTLSKASEINLNESLSLDLTEVEIGKTDLNEIIEIHPIFFDLNSSVIRDDAKIELNKVVDLMKENPRMVIELGSHTDSRGEDKYNLWLSDRRAKSSANYIISQGIEQDRITGKGYGETRLKVSDAEIAKAATTEEKEALHQKNRRTEFIIVKMK